LKIRDEKGDMLQTILTSLYQRKKKKMKTESEYEIKNIKFLNFGEKWGGNEYYNELLEEKPLSKEDRGEIGGGDAWLLVYQ